MPPNSRAIARALAAAADFGHTMENLTRTLGMGERKWRALVDAFGVPRPFDWHRDAFEDYVRAWPPIVGYGRGRPLLAPEIERHLVAENVLRHRRVVEAVDYTPLDHRLVASLACGHMVELAGRASLRLVGLRLPCPECAAV